MPNVGQVGRNNGITGLFDLPGFVAKFGVKIYKWEVRQTGKTRTRYGRGSNFYGAPKWLVSGGNWILKASFDPATMPPAPDQWKGQTGSATVQIMEGRQIVQPLLVNDFGFDFDASKNTIPGIAIAATATGPAVYDGWDSVPATDPTKSDQQQYEGTSWTFDPNKIQDAGEITIDWWGNVDDTDVAELTKLEQVLAAAALPPGYKKREGTIRRQAVDGGIIVLRYGRTDTKDDVLLPRNTRNTDPSKLDSRAHAADFNQLPADPMEPHTVLVGRSSVKLNDAITLNDADYGPRTNTQTLEQDGSFARIDDLGLDSEGQNTKQFDTAAEVPEVPSSPDPTLQHVARSIQEVTADQSKAVDYFQVNTSVERLLFPETPKVTDPFGLASTSTYGNVFPTGDEPSMPVISGLVFRQKRVLTLSSPNTSDDSVVFWQFAERTSADDETFDRTRSSVDANDITSNQTLAFIFVNGSPPTPGELVMSGLKLVDFADQRLTNVAASNLFLRVYRYGKLDSLDDLKLPKIKTTVDANHIEDDAIRVKEWSTDDSPPDAPDDPPTNNVELITYTDLKITPVIDATPGLNLRVFMYGPANSGHRRILDNYETTTNTDHLEESAIRAYLDGDSVPSTPANMLLRDTKVRPLTLALGTNRTLTVLVFGTRTHTQDATYPRIKTYDDPINIDDDAVRAEFWNVGDTPPATATDPPANNVKQIGFTDVPWTPQKNMRVFVYGPKSTGDSLVLDNYQTSLDASAIASTAVRAALDGDSIIDPTDQPYVLRRTIIRPITLGLGVNRVLTVKEYGLTTSEDDVTFRESDAVDDPFRLFTRRITTLESSGTGTTPGDFSLTQRNLLIGDKEYAGNEVQQFNRQLKRLTKLYSTDSKTVEGNISAERVRLVNIGNIVNVIVSRQRGSAGSRIALAAIEWWRSTGIIEITRRFEVATDPMESLLHLSQLTTRNNGQILGINAGFLMYVGASWIYAAGISSSRVIGIKYKLAFDSLLFQQTIDGGEYDTALTTVPVGYAVLGTLGLELIIQYPVLSDLSFVYA